MVRVVGIDHLVIRVSDYEKSKQFYQRLFTFMGFEVLDEYEDAIGWTNGKTCVFRRKAATDSDASQPVIPKETSHRFQGKPAPPVRG